MDLVHNDVGHIGQEGIRLQPLEEDAGGAEEQPRLGRGLGLQPDAVAHQPAHRLTPLLGHAAGHA